LIGLVLLANGVFAWAEIPPFTTAEVTLMLRTGYSSETILRELATRHFSDVFDAETEKRLQQSGANAALLEALRNGAFQASAAQLAALEKKRSKLKQDPASSGDSHGPAREAASTKPTSTAPADQIYRVLKGDLIIRHQGSFVPYDDEMLQSKKLFLYFFSANASPPGRKFTPRLVEYYEQIVAQHPELEVVFFSADRSQFGMETYMNQSNMPWPAVTFAAVSAQVTAMQIDVTRDVPALILLDSSGKLLSRSQANGGGLDQVLADLDKVLAQRAAVASAPRQ
jgi:nucleoredoxin